VLDAAEPGADLAGFESFRTTVWGSAAMHALSARYFPVLDGADLTVPPDEVPEFLREWFVATISARLANIKAAGEQALAAGGGVVIW
jgi:hypothetical protein